MPVPPSPALNTAPKKAIQTVVLSHETILSNILSAVKLLERKKLNGDPFTGRFPSRQQQPPQQQPQTRSAVLRIKVLPEF
jgi:hypothetical protein